MKPRYHHARRTFSEWTEDKIAIDSHLHHKILWLVFGWMNDVNKQNCRSEENPEFIIETPLHPVLLPLLIHISSKMMSAPERYG